MALSKVLMVTGLLVLPAAAVARDLLPEEASLITAAVKRQLKDPFSAQFELLPFNGSPDYCGRVNAKNGYGGYVGFRVFQVKLSIGADGNILSVEPPYLGGEPSPFEDTDWRICQALAKEAAAPPQ